jgi:hypothetical protein
MVLAAPDSSRPTTMPASPLTEPLAWRGVGAPSRFRDDCRPGLPRPAEDVSRPVRGFRDPHRRFSYRRGARRYGAREPLRSARLFPGRRPAVPIRERAGSDAQHDLALRRSLPIGASTRTCWAPSSPACWSTRSATISAHPMPMWWQSKPRRTEQVRAVTFRPRRIKRTRQRAVRRLFAEAPGCSLQAPKPNP